MRLVDFNNSKILPHAYGGNAGRKLCIEGPDGTPWMLKFPEPTAGMKGNVASYTTSPLSEWLGSHIYKSLGIPVHETLLGFREGKLVCACKDFTYPDKSLIEFHDLKNTVSDELTADFEERPSDGRSLYLSDVLSAISTLGDFIDPDKAMVRFWDMFVTDAFIGNADRNNENWGILTNNQGVIGLAPVYDNGNAFFNKRRSSTMSERAMIDTALEQDAIGGVQSCYKRNDGHRIAPIKYISEMADENCNAAVVRFMERLDFPAVVELIDSIPNSYLNFTVMNDDVKEFHKRVLSRRIEDCFSPTYDSILVQSEPDRHSLSLLSEIVADCNQAAEAQQEASHEEPER